MKVYDNREWLYEQYINQGKSISEIAREQGVTRGVIGGRVRKFNIKKPKELITFREPVKYVKVECSLCGEEVEKPESYITRNRAKGLRNFYCDQTCFGLAHSVNMTGKGNPNYGNINKITPNDFRTKEQMSQHAKETWEKHRKNGMFQERISKMLEGMRKFYETDKGKAIRRKQGYLSIKAQRRTESSIERKMREELTRRVITFEQEKPFLERYFIDFYLPEYNIAIECDGDYWHSLPNVVSKDRRRDSEFKKRGVEVLRFWESEINKDVEACVDMVLAKINEKEAG